MKTDELVSEETAQVYGSNSVNEETIYDAGDPTRNIRPGIINPRGIPAVERESPLVSEDNKLTDLSDAYGDGERYGEPRRAVRPSPLHLLPRVKTSPTATVVVLPNRTVTIGYCSAGIKRFLYFKKGIKVSILMREFQRLKSSVPEMFDVI